MKIRVISWEEKTIREYEIDYIHYEEDGVSFSCKTLFAGKNCQTFTKIPYNEFLGIKEN